MLLAAMAAIVASACTDYVTGPGATPPAPTNLSYQLQPSGDPQAPTGLLLRWTAITDGSVAVYNVYSRGSSTAPFDLRGSTTSPSFHDEGVPDLEYYVTAQGQGGAESAASASVVVDERLRLVKPASLTSISLNGAIHLQWSDNAFQTDPAGFSYYRVYSTAYDLDSNLCGTGWTLEGTTIAPTFLAAALTNGAPRCFGISAISIEGFESLWSPLRYDTPRPDARNVLVYTQAGDPLRSGFRFWLDANGNGRADSLELGLVSAGNSASVDFTLTPSGSQLQIVPVRAGVQLQQYGTQPISSLTDIDIAPAGGYAAAGLIAQPGFGYVFQIAPGDGYYRYGAVRVTATGSNYVIFDWSYQTDKGNPELIRMAVK
jgi:hypothetical protein